MRRVSDGYVFFAGFDGSNNDFRNPSLAGDTQSTSVGQIFEGQYSITGSKGGGYYAGVGTPGTLPGSTVANEAVTDQINITANRAWNDFSVQAQTWLSADPSRSVNDLATAVTGFSRGGASAVRFLQMVTERGLKVGNEVIAAPGQVRLEGMVLIDPVSTGYVGSLVLPEGLNPYNAIVIRANNEYRKFFEGDDFGNDTRVRTILVTGNHGDAGGFYDNGLGALYLQGVTAFLQRIGVKVSDVPPGRQFDASAPVVIHDEGSNSWYWPEYAHDGLRRVRTVPRPVLAGDLAIDCQTGLLDNGDGTNYRETTFRDGTKAFQLLDKNGNVILSAASPKEAFYKDANGNYLVTRNDSDVVRSFNPATTELTYSSVARGTITIDAAGYVRRLQAPAQPPVDASVELGGDTWQLAANGQLYRIDENGRVIIRDGLLKNGTINQLGPNGVLTPVALFLTRNTANGEVTRTVSAQGQVVSTALLQRFDDGTALETTTYGAGAGTQAGRSVIQSINTQGATSGSIKDTPNPDGTKTRLVTTSVNGVEVVLLQLNTQAEPSKFTTTAVQVDGQDAVSADAFAAFIDGRYTSPIEYLREATKRPAELQGVVAAADGRDSDGLTPTNLPPNQTTWWNDKEVATGVSLFTSGVQALLTGKPSALGIWTYNLASSAFKAPPEFPQAGVVVGGLDTVIADANFIDAIESDNVGRKTASRTCRVINTLRIGSAPSRPCSQSSRSNRRFFTHNLPKQVQVDNLLEMGI